MTAPIIGPALIRSGPVLDTIGSILLVLLVIVVVLAVIVLAIVRLAHRVDRRLGRLLGRAPRAPRRTRARPAQKTKARPRPAPAREPTFRIRSVFEPRPAMAWQGPGTTLRLHELAIAAPLAYVASDRRASGLPLDPSEIIPALPVDRRTPAAPADEATPYAGLDPAQRWAYLAWLAGGRGALPADPALLTLHFMGLERRALADSADLALVVQEVCRLRDLVAQEQAAPPASDVAGAPAPPARRFTAFMRQSASLLWMLVALHPAAFTERDLRVLAGRTTSWSEEALIALLAWFARHPGVDGAAPLLPAWAARLAAAQSPGARRSVVLERVPEQFEALFEARFAERHARGVPLRISKRERAISYRPTNRTLAPVECRAPDALAIASQFAPLVALFNACIDDLRPAARVQAGGEAMTLKQWSALPDDLRASMDSPFAEALSALAADRADESGHAIVPIGDVVRAVRMDSPDRATFTAAQCQALARALAEAGMGLEPDARLTEQGMSRDAGVVLCAAPIPIEAGADAASRYLAAACVLRLGAAVALADGEASQVELEPIALELERAFDLSEHDHRRLDALLALLRARGSEVKGLGKRVLAALAPEARRAVGRLLIAVASADGRVDDAERATLRSCYRALGLEAADLDAALAAVEAPESASTAGVVPLQLDRAAVRAIMAETREVAQMLAEAMRAGDAQEPEGDSAPPQNQDARPEAGPAIQAHTSTGSAMPGPAPAADSTPPVEKAPSGPGPRYAAFFAALVAREVWPLADAEALAREHRHMLSGALEAINDWAFEHAGGPLLIEEGDRLIIDPDRRRMLGAAGAP